MVKVHYTGRTREGKVFDTSKFANRSKEQQEMIKQQRPDDYDKDEPVEFPAEPRHPGLDRGSAAGRQGRHDYALDSRRSGLRSARCRP